MKLIKTYFEWENLFEQAKSQPNVNGGVLMIKSSTDPTKVTKEQSLNYTGIKEEGKDKLSEVEYEIAPKSTLLKDLFLLGKDKSGNMGKYMSIKSVGKVKPGTDKLVIGDKSIIDKGSIVLQKSDLDKAGLKIRASGNGLLVLARIAGGLRDNEKLTDINDVIDYGISFNMGGNERGSKINYLKPNPNDEFFELLNTWVVFNICLGLFYSNPELRKLIPLQDVEWSRVFKDKLFVNDPIKYASEDSKDILQEENYFVEVNPDLTKVKSLFEDLKKSFSQYLVGKPKKVNKEGHNKLYEILNGIVNSIIPSKTPDNFLGADGVFESYRKTLRRCFMNDIFSINQVNLGLVTIQKVNEWDRPVSTSGVIAAADVKNKSGEY